MDLFNIQDVTFLDKIVYQNFAIKKDNWQKHAFKAFK